jgi:putative endopeptidase
LALTVRRPASIRPQIVRNLDPWYGAFDGKAGQKLFLKPECRVKV